LLTDIQGIEDHHGDMDFKVSGHPVNSICLARQVSQWQGTPGTWTA
jgi:hypothetical protein